MSKLELYAKGLKLIEQRKRENKLAYYKPYPFQETFHAAGLENQERMLMAANRVGKTECAAAEVAFHLTGRYPDWWEGRKFEKPILAWTGSPTNETSRDIVQKALFGGTGEELGTGWIPKGSLVGKPKMRQAGVSDVIDTAKIRHTSGGRSTVVMKTYEQGWRKWQGTEPDVVWDDEEPEEMKIYTETLTRVMTSHGLILVTFTPLLGETELVTHFMEPKTHGIFLEMATWDDAPHLTQEDKDRLKASYPDHEVQARTSGVPMMGEGRVFTVSEEDIKIDPFEIPHYWPRICGIDFGIDHPFAASWVTWDRDNDVIYVYDGFRVSGQLPVYHASGIRHRGEWIPVAWPHDGLNREKQGGQELWRAYLEEGVRMLPKSARYRKKPGESEKGGAQPQEPIILEVLDRMKSGRFKVFSSLPEWFSEFRSYHRKDGKLVSVRDDFLKSTFYAVMMKRYATTAPAPHVYRPSTVAVSARI